MLETQPLDTTPLDLDKKTKKSVLSGLNDLISAAHLLRQSVTDGTANVSHRDTMLGLMEYKLTDIGRNLSYESKLAADVEKRHAEIRKLNLENHRLRERLGQESNGSPELIEALIDHYQNVFTTWYESAGFHYAQTERLTAYGMTMDFSDEVETEPFHHLSRDKKLNEHMDARIPHLFGDGTPFEIVRDGRRAELLDTDGNKSRIQTIMKTAFPDVQFRKFTGRRNDYGSHSLRINVFVTWKDIAALYENITKGQDKKKKGE